MSAEATEKHMSKLTSKPSDLSDGVTNHNDVQKHRGRAALGGDRTDARAGAHRTGGGRRGDMEGTPPSITVPQSYISDVDIRVLRVGIDSLYLSFQGEIYPAVDHDFTILKHLAQSRDKRDKAQAQIEIHGHLFEVSDKGQRSDAQSGFAYVLEDNDYRIAVSAGSSTRMPLAWVKISSECLTLKGVKPTVDELIKIISEIGDAMSPTVSRVDICADFQTKFDFDSIQRIAWVTRARDKDSYSEYDKLTGWVVGKGSSISMRLYDKVAEIVKSGKAYLIDLWLSNGWDTNTPVWRLELQVKREVLSQLGVISFEKMMDSLGGIWGYGFQTWLRLSISQPGDSNRARWPTHPIWETLANITWRTDDQPLKRKYAPVRVPSMEKLMQLYSSYLTTFMATNAITSYVEGVEAFQKQFEAYQQSRCTNKLNISFEEWLETEVRLKGRKFNTINNLTELDAPKAKERNDAI